MLRSYTYPIRAAQPAEAIQLAKVHVQSWQETYAGILPQAYLDGLCWQDREPMWQAAIARPDRHAVAVYEDERAVAVAMTGPIRDVDPAIVDGELYLIYVLQSHQRRGIGRELAARCRTILARSWWH